MITWTKEWDSSDDGSLVSGPQIGQLQDDIDAGLTGQLPTISAGDQLKMVRVKSDYSGYEVVSQTVTQTIEATIASGSAASTVYCVSPIAGNVTSVYTCQFVAARAATYTVKAGSAGSTIASTTTTTAGVAGAVTLLTLGTVAVTAGQSISIARGDQGTAGESVITVVIVQTI